MYLCIVGTDTNNLNQPFNFDEKMFYLSRFNYNIYKYYY